MYDETLAKMKARTQPAGDYFVWDVAGKPVSVHLHLDVIDRLQTDVMRAFAAVPKRGAEVGGILLGTIQDGAVSMVRVEDYEPVKCEHKTGPSFVLSDEDRTAFRQACDDWQPDELRPMYAVGFYRSHTRDSLSLAPEDHELLDEFFPSPAHIAMLIKPYGSKPSLAGFFFREDGVFPKLTSLEFPFRRRELTGSDAPLVAAASHPEAHPMFRPNSSKSHSGLRSAIWIPLSFVFLLFGVALGLMIALARGSSSSARESEDFSLGLSVSRSDDNLSVRWDRDAAAIHAADRGVLEIEDGGYTKSVDLDTAQLKNGSIIYRNSSGTVRFRLTVYPKAKVTVTETVDWRR